MGSAADIGYSADIAAIAANVGQEIARRGYTLLFGAEKDVDSLSTIACRAANEAGGLTVGFTYGKGKGVVERDAGVIIPTGLERGGGREFILALSCDALIAIRGGSGTLSEILAAYQADIPLVGIEGTGGMTGLFIERSFDSRRPPMYRARDAINAVDIAEREARRYLQRFGYFLPVEEKQKESGGSR